MPFFQVFELTAEDEALNSIDNLKQHPVQKWKFNNKNFSLLKVWIDKCFSDQISDTSMWLDQIQMEG